MPDEQLAGLLSSKTPGAFSATAERYLDTLYDFALRLTLNRETAAAAVLAALERTPETLAESDASNLKTLLLGLVRDEALARAPRRAAARAGVLAGDDPIFSRTAETNDPAPAVWAWTAVRELRQSDFSLLALSLLEGLTTEEIARIASLSSADAAAAIARLRASFEDAYQGLVLFSQGAAGCEDLATLVEPHPEMSAALRRDILRHAAGCAQCPATLAIYPNAEEALAGLAMIPADERLIAQIGRASCRERV